MTLEARDIRVRFGGVTALDSVDIRVEPGQVVALVGPNGSGKSTLFNAITGFVPLDSGSVLVDETDVTHQPADARIRAGLTRTFQTPRIDPEVTMVDSIMCGFLPSMRTALLPSLVGLPRVREAEARARAEARALMEHFDLLEDADVPMGQLPLGTIRLADVMRAMASSPRYLLLDEPAAGLYPAEQKRLTAAVRRIAASDVGVLLVEHNFPIVRDVADELVVLEKGQVLASGDPHTVAGDPRVVKAYLGGRDPVAARPRKSSAAGPALECHTVTVSYGRAQVCRDVDVSVGHGEVTAVLGANGAGKSSLLAALAGLRLHDRRWRGRITLNGTDLSAMPAERRLAAGLAFVPERRGNLFPGLTVEENLALAARPLSNSEKENARDHVHQQFPPLRSLMGTHAGLLSGGEQQMVAIAMALVPRPAVLLLDEPTQGLAPAVLETLVDTFLTLREQGLGVLVAEQNHAFAAAIADRFLVLSHGQVVVTGDSNDLRDRDAIAASYL